MSFDTELAQADTAFDDLLSVSITYARGVDNATITAISEIISFDTVDIESGVVIRQDIRDFVFDSADLDLGAGQVPPERGDTITLTISGSPSTYQVVDVAGGKHFEYEDPAQRLIRVHTKGV